MKKIFGRLTAPFSVRRSEPRQPGHYWVHWADTPSGKPIYRIAYYDAYITGRWFLPGDDRMYSEHDFIGVADRPLTRFWGGRYGKMVLRSCMVVVSYNLGLIAYRIYELITLILK